MPMFPGAQSFVNEILKVAEVWIATSRPWQRLDNIDPDTIEWLNRNNLHFDGIVYGDDKYELLANAVEKDRIVGVVDDLTEQLKKADLLGLPTCQVYRPHNQNERWTPGSEGFDPIAWWVQERVGLWNESR